VDCADSPKADIASLFSDCHAFFEQAAAGENVLIHCMLGTSRYVLLSLSFVTHT
jgi:protein-tyrosine phosphatase